MRRPGEDPHSATSPIVGRNRVYIGYSEPTDENGVYDARVAGFNAKTGNQQLDVSIGGGRIAGLLLGDNRLFATTWGSDHQHSRLLGFSIEGGSKVWERTLSDVTGSPILHDGSLYVTTRDDDNAVYAYDRDGTERWRTPVDGECYNEPCAAGGVIFVGLADGSIVALDERDGQQQWHEYVVEQDPCCPDIQGTPTVADDRLYIPGIKEQVTAVDVTDGSTVWTTRVVEGDYGNAIPSPAVADGDVYVNTNHGGLVALDAATGEIRWRSNQNGYFQPPAVGGDVVVFPRHESIVAYDTGGTELWTVDMKVPDIGMAGYIMDAEVAIAHDMSYVALHDGRLYAIGATG